MRVVVTIVGLLVLIGAGALHYGFTRSAIGEWQAGRLPYPGVGVSAHDTFELVRGGRFELKILSPCTEQEKTSLREETVDVGLHVVIIGQNGLVLDKVINSVRVGSWGASGRTFSPNEIWVLPLGEYDISIDGRADVPPLFLQRGALIYLERMEDVGPSLGFALAKVIGYCCLGLAATAAFILALRARQTHPKPVPNPAVKRALRIKPRKARYLER